jgi:hypothetical protein
LTGFIGNGSIIDIAIQQQFHSSAWCGPAGDNRVTGSSNPGDVESRGAADVRRAWRKRIHGGGSFGFCLRKSGRTRILND